MSDRYYKNAIMFNMRDFISKIISKYIEHLQENFPDDVEQTQKVMQNFKVWLYKQTNN